MSVVNMLIRKQYHAAKHHFNIKGDFHGLYISDDDAEKLVHNPLGLPEWVAAGRDGDERLKHPDFESRRRFISERVRESLKSGVELRLEHLKHVCGLETIDLDILLICLGPELNSGYSKIYAYLQDDLTKKNPTVDLVLNILSSTFEEKMNLRKRLRPGSPLIDHGLILTEPDPTLPATPFLSRFVHVDSSIASYVLDDDVFHEWPLNLFHTVSPVQDLDSLVLDGLMRKELNSLLRKEALTNTIIYLFGPYGTGKKSTAEALCHAWGKKLWISDIENHIAVGVRELGDYIRRICRDACLNNACVYWDSNGDVFKHDHKIWLKEFMQCLDKEKGVSFLSGTSAVETLYHVRRSLFIPFEFTNPSYGQRMKLWKRSLENAGFDPGIDVTGLSSGFNFSGGQIRDAVQTAINLSTKNDNKRDTISASELRSACLLQSGSGLSTLARRIRPTYSWDDIVLPPDRIEQLRDIVNHARFRSFVMDSWGFGRKLSGGKGLNVLFAGPSGTGKTMSAEIMAFDLGLHLYKIDLARVVSKYIGETEKNLSRIFEEAETSNAILFFDEADAIFGKRSDVHDAHDRYANIETSYLLQKMEEYEGVTILATNFRRNMDDAFVRRIQYAVEFPFPEKHDRKEIWKKTWPCELPLAQDIDFDLLAGRFELSGGNIRNICVNAAFIAAADGKTVTMNHLMRSTRNEYRKMGKLMMGGEFSELRTV